MHPNHPKRGYDGDTSANITAGVIVKAKPGSLVTLFALNAVGNIEVFDIKKVAEFATATAKFTIPQDAVGLPIQDDEIYFRGVNGIGIRGANPGLASWTFY